MSETTGHDRVREPREVPVTVPASLEPFITFAAELIADARIRELQINIEGDQRNDHIKAENVPGL